MRTPREILGAIARADQHHAEGRDWFDRTIRQNPEAIDHLTQATRQWSFLRQAQRRREIIMALSDDELQALCSAAWYTLQGFAVDWLQTHEAGP